MRAKDFLLSSSSLNLFEVKMSPSNLKKLTSDIDALVGIEFEMIIPDLQVRDDDYYPENDMDQDERANSIADIIDFFGANDQNSSYELRKLEEKLRADYNRKLDEMVRAMWEKDGEEAFKKWIRENVPDREVAEFHNVAYDDPSEIELSNEQWNEFIKSEWEEETHNYDSAYESYKDKLIDDETIEEDTVLVAIGIDWMEDVYSNYDIDWPYKEWSGEDPEEVYSGLAEELGNYVGHPVEYSTSYHGDIKSTDSYMIEPDGSITPDDTGAGIEVVSPPLPLEEAFDELKNVIAWAESKDAYTNSSTGLHINVSVPGYSREKLDFVKLALLSGDKYVLEKFDRLANTYAISALDKIDELATETDKELFFRTLKGKMNNATGSILHPSATAKYTSINVQGNRIEFRGPGGDWMSKDYSELENTVRRFVVALDAALDPTKYQQEYLKKLTKSYSPKRGSTEELFVKYTAGALTKQELKHELSNLRSSKDKTKLYDKGIVSIPQSEVKLGDWVVEQPMENNTFARLFLKKTRDVDSPEKALSAALELDNRSFDTSRIEDIIATEFDGSDRYYIHERGYPFVSREVYAATPYMAVESAVNRFDLSPMLELTASLRTDIENRKNNQQLIDRSQPIYAIVSHTSGISDDVSQCVMSGSSPEHAIARANLWFSSKFSQTAYQVDAYPIEEYTQENPGNDVNKLKLYSVTNSEGYANSIVVATSKKQAGEVYDILNYMQDRPTGVTLAYEWKNVRDGEIESRLASQNYILQIRSHDDEFLDVSKNITPGQPSGNKTYRVNYKDVTYGGALVQANSPEEAIEKAKKQYGIVDDSREIVAVEEK